MPQGPLAHLIHEAINTQQLTQAEVIRRIKAAAIADGEPNARYTRTSITQWLKGTAIPRPTTRRWIASALGIPPSELAKAADAQERYRKAKRARPYESHGGVQYSVSSKDGIEFEIRSADDESITLVVKRREFLKALTVGAGLVVLKESPHSPGASLLAISDSRPKRISFEYVDAAKELTATFRRQDNQFGGGYARAVAVHYLDSNVTPALRHGHYDEQVGQALFGTAAQLAHLVAWMAYDMQDHSAAKLYMTKALELTAASADSAFAGEILAGMSHHAIHLGKAGETIDLARASRQVATKVQLPALLAEAYVMEAHGHALLSDSKECAAALHNAELAFDRSQATDVPEWLQYLDEKYLAARFAHCFRDLDDLAQAEHFGLRAVRMSANLARARAFNTALLATAYVKDDLERACQVGLEAVELASRLKSGRTLEYIHDCVRRLRQQYQDDPRVERFIEQSRDVLGGAPWD